MLDSENILRLGLFIAIFVSLALWELRRPRRVLQFPRRRRWISHGALALINTLLLRLLYPVLAVTVALLMTDEGLLPRR